MTVSRPRLPKMQRASEVVFVVSGGAAVVECATLIHLRKYLPLAPALLVLLGWHAAVSALLHRHLENASEIAFQPMPPGMAPGPTPGRPPALVSAVGADGCVWIHQALAMVESGSWRLRHTDFDNAPQGRDVHWNSGFAWWIIALAWVDHVATGNPLENAVVRMAAWANPVLFAGLLVAASCLVARRFGLLAGLVLGCAMIGCESFYEAFLAGYADHHGMHNAAILVCLLGLVGGGLGWVRPPGTAESAQRWFMLSAIAGGIGLWVSALTMAICLVGVGLGFLASVLFFPRPADGARLEPGLWKLWGRTGALVSTAFYLLEYAPNHFDLRLEVNHPLYALAWWGGGELMAIIQRGHIQGTWPAGARAWTGVAAAGLSMAALPMVLILGGTAVYQPFDPFLYNLHQMIGEFQPPFSRVKALRPGPMLVAYLTPAIIGGLMLLLVFTRSVPTWLRRGLCLLLGPGLLFTVAFLFQARWALGAASAIVAATPLVLLALLEIGRGWQSRWRWLPATGFALLLALFFPGFFLAMTWGMAQRKTDLDIVETLELTMRDVAQTIRKDVGPDRPVVVLSSPTCSTFLAYFGNFHALGTLYWENLQGLRAAAGITGTTSEATAIQRLRDRRVTHIVHYEPESFILTYFALENPQSSREDWQRSFGYRTFTAKEIPRWLRPLPYRVPPPLRRLKSEIIVFEFAPDQTLPQAHFNLGQYFMVNDRFTEAERSFADALQAEPRAWDARIARGIAIVSQRRFDEGARELASALAMAPLRERPRLLAEAGQIFAQRGSPAYALAFLQKSLEPAPDNPAALQQVAWILATAREDELRDGARAVVLGERAVTLAPESPECHLALAAARAETGDFLGAIATAEAASRLPLLDRFPQLRQRLAAHLESYRAGRPWRE